MAEQTTSTATVKTEPSEFTEVFTTSDLLSVPPSSSSKFSTVITETSILETDLPPSPIHENDLVALYDETFPTPSAYHEFADQKLTIWKDSIEFKYFNALYLNHRHSTETIKKLRDQAQSLLEEANRIQGRNRVVKQEIRQFTTDLPQEEFRKRIHRPTKVYPKPRTFVRETFPPIRRHCPTIRKPQFPVTPHRSTPFPTSQFASTSRILRCFTCNSPEHFKWTCPQYRCPFCNRAAPGHSQKDCPRNKPSRYEDDIRGYFDIEGDDGNMRGEC